MIILGAICVIWIFIDNPKSEDIDDLASFIIDNDYRIKIIWGLSFTIVLINWYHLGRKNIKSDYYFINSEYSLLNSILTAASLAAITDSSLLICRGIIGELTDETPFFINPEFSFNIPMGAAMSILLVYCYTQYKNLILETKFVYNNDFRNENEPFDNSIEDK